MYLNLQCLEGGGSNDFLCRVDKGVPALFNPESKLLLPETMALVNKLSLVFKVSGVQGEK